MSREHSVRCVMAAIEDGGKVIDNPTARWLLKSRYGISVRDSCIIRDGPIRPVWGGDDNFFIPYWDGGEAKEKLSGRWVEKILEEERKNGQREGTGDYPAV